MEPDESVPTLPVFPLKTVLFPGGLLPLRIFEPRYIDMVGDCVREETGFVVCLICAGNEAGAPASFFPMGTECHIVDWDALPDGLLGITVQGRRKVEIVSHTVRPDGLAVGGVVPVEPEPAVPLPEAYRPLCGLLDTLVDELGPPYSDMARHHEDGGWLSARLVEILPLDLGDKQALFELRDPEERLHCVWNRVTSRPKGAL